MSELTLDDLMEMRDALDSKNIPIKERVVRLGLPQFYDLCQVQGVTANSFKTRMLDEGIIEVYL